MSESQLDLFLSLEELRDEAANESAIDFDAKFFEEELEL